MSCIKKLNCFLVILSAVIFCGNNAYAFNPIKVDPLKTSFKFGDLVQKQAEVFEEKMKEIGESQFATFIGNGIEASKKGAAFMQENIKKARDAVDVVKKTVDDAKNSEAYKIVTLSEQLASEKKKMADLEKSRDTEIESIKSEMEMKRVAETEKIAIAEENYKISLKMIENEIAELKTEEEKEVKKKEIEKFRQENEEIILAMKENLTEIEAETEEKVKKKKEEIGATIAAVATVVGSLSRELIGYIDRKKYEEGTQETDPKNVIEDAIDDFSREKGKTPTLSEVNKKRENRRRKGEVNSITSSNYSSSIINSTEDKKEEESLNSIVSSTMNGKSEALQTAISQTAVQLNTIYKYLLLELKSMEMETANLIFEKPSYEADAPVGAIDICDYEIKKNDLASILKKSKEASGKIGDAINKGKEAAQAVKDGMQTIKETGKDISNVVDDGTDDSVTAIQGMM